MKKSRFTEEQIVFVLRQTELETSVPEVCRRLGISGATFYTWCKKYGGISPQELKLMRQLDEENLRLKKLVADLSLGEAMLRDVLAKKRTDAGANGSGICRHATEPAKGRYALPCGSAADRSGIVLWWQTTVRYASISGRAAKPGTTEFMSCSGVKAGGRTIIHLSTLQQAGSVLVSQTSTS